jgi:hypothetical protein
MVRILAEHRDPETGEVFAGTLAIATANALKLYEDDGSTIPTALVEVAEELAREDALVRAGARR